FNGQTYTFTDPTGDDLGPKGTYTYPQDSTFGHQMDIVGVRVEVGATTMNLNLHMADYSSVWNPQYGCDSVYFTIFFQLPGQRGRMTIMPKLSGSVPDGFAWTFDQFSGGFDNTMYTTADADATHYGAATVAPTIKVDPGTKTVIFTYDRNNFGIASWAG